MQAVHRAVAELFTLGASLEGKISGEHGIGHFKRPHLDKCATPEFLAAMRSVKQALDPADVLNPGKLFAP